MDHGFGEWDVNIGYHDQVSPLKASFWQELTNVPEE
jgi:hypothetical protein